MKLADLSPSLSPPGGAYQVLKFLCPRCQKHQVEAEIWTGPAGPHRVPHHNGTGAIFERRLWNATQGPHKDWGSLTLSPSIDRTGKDPCGGWHGHVINGEAV